MKKILLQSLLYCIVVIQPVEAQIEQLVLAKLTDSTSYSNLVWSGSNINGKRDGEWKASNIYYSPAVVAHYQNGKAEGQWTYFYAYQKIALTGNYKAGKKIGVWVAYDAYGDSAVICNYLNDQMSGSYVEYHKKGRKRIEGQFLAGKKNENWKYYRDQRNSATALNYSYTYKNDTLNGIYAQYWNGKLTHLFTMQSGIIQGPFSQIIEDSAYVITGQYDNGAKIRSMDNNRN